MVNTQIPSPATTPPSTRPSRLLRWSGGIGSVALAGLSIAHLVVNSIGFAATPDAGWPLFLLFGIGVSALAAGLAMLTWRYAVQGRGRRVARVFVALAGIICCYNVVTVLQLHPEVILVPAGPGPWSLIAGPALLLTALLPRREPTQ
ncbi:hypothetical protein [Ruania zhangjianzhongii]|uniref:hypothetical protein n=1 Tax=Ruania zhangjianzhongii TaxID=2603206 RepID=UPI0011C81D1F|nr:hypothetical protein [Ruania zhangjianzhongii]